MKILLLNQYGSDSGAPTGRILGELADGLDKRGHETRLLATDLVYGRPARGLSRILHEGMTHLRMVWRGWRSPQADVVISLTSPACLAVTAGVIARLHGARHFHWAMDVYPDVGARLGELKSRALVAILRRLMRRAYQRADAVITLDEDMRDYLRANYGVDSTVIEPFPPEISWPQNGKRSEGARRWLYSGNFGRAHEIDVLLQVQKRLEERSVDAELVLQGQGPQFLSSQDAAGRLGLRRVQWRAPVPMDELGSSLLDSDVLVVTRKAEMKGLLLPSKLMLAELSGRNILWIGDTDGKTARRLANEKRHGVFALEGVEAMAAWLAKVFSRNSVDEPPEPRPPEETRQEALRRWEKLLPADDSPPGKSRS